MKAYLQFLRGLLSRCNTSVAQKFQEELKACKFLRLSVIELFKPILISVFSLVGTVPRSDDLYCNFAHKSSVVFWILCNYIYFWEGSTIWNTAPIWLFLVHIYIFMPQHHLWIQGPFRYKMKIYICPFSFLMPTLKNWINRIDLNIAHSKNRTKRYICYYKIIKR